MQPGYPPGQDPYGQQQPYQDPYGQPQYGQQPQQPQQPQYGQQPYQDPYAQPQQQPYQDPYAQPPVSGSPYPTSGGAYQQPTSGGAYPTSPAYPGYQQPGYQQPGYPGYGAPASGNNTLAIVSMILGIVSIPLACCFYIGILPGIAGVVLGVMGQRKAAEMGGSGKGMALAGIITGGIGAALALLWIILNIIGTATSWTYT